MSTQTITGSAQEVRQQIRSNKWRGITSGVAPGHVQANLAILPKDLAFDFLLFCQRNPKPCALWAVIDSGQVEPALTTPDAPILTDVAGHSLTADLGVPPEGDHQQIVRRDDLVSFLLGCSFSFETAMVDAGIPLRHQQNGHNVAMYITNIATTPAGFFSGPMVVSMRPVKRDQVVRGDALDRFERHRPGEG